MVPPYSVWTLRQSPLAIINPLVFLKVNELHISFYIGHLCIGSYCTSIPSEISENCSKSALIPGGNISPKLWFNVERSSVSKRVLSQANMSLTDFTLSYKKDWNFHLHLFFLS